MLNYVLLGGIGLLALASFVWSIISTHIPPKCIHGIRGGKSMSNEKCKCPECEKARILLIERTQKQQIRQESEKLYVELRNEAWNRYKARLPYRVSSIDKMTGFAFEDYCAKLLKRMGYSVIQTKKTGDGGKDAFAYMENKKFLVECKHYSGDQKITRPHLQKLFAAMNEEHADGGIFIATCAYSQEALAYGEKYGIWTIDREKLLSLATECETESDHELSYTLCCPICGEKVNFLFFGDANTKECSKGHTVPCMFSKKPLYYYNPSESDLQIDYYPYTERTN